MHTGPCRQLLCSLCRREKMQADKYQLQTTGIPKRPFTKASIDHNVEMPTSHYGNKNISVMVDHLTSRPVVKAIPDKEATAVANAIFEKPTLEHESPEILLTDNAKEYTINTLACVCQEFGIEQHFTSPYTPRSNGKTEEFNKFLKASIRKFCQENKVHGIRFLTKLCSYIGVAHTPLLVRLHTHLYAIEIHQYPYINQLR